MVRHSVSRASVDVFIDSCGRANQSGIHYNNAHTTWFSAGLERQDFRSPLIHPSDTAEQDHLVKLSESEGERKNK